MTNKKATMEAVISDYAVSQIMSAVSGDKSNEEQKKRLKEIKGTIMSLQPRDKVEEMLITQVIIAHDTSLECLIS